MRIGALTVFLLFLTHDTTFIICYRSTPLISKSTEVPYADSIYFAKSIVALNARYDHLPEDSPVKAYIRDHCLFLLKPLTGSFTLPLSLKPEDLVQHENTVQLKRGYSAYYTKPAIYTNTAGVYLFIHLMKRAIAQCGSCIN